MINDLTGRKLTVDDLISRLGFDELDVLESVMIVEFEYNLEISDEDWEAVLNQENKPIQTIVDFVKNRITEGL